MNTTAETWTVEDASTDLRVMCRRLWRRRWWILASVAVTTILVGIYAITATPIYRAATVLVPASSERNGISGGLGAALGQLGGLASLAGINFNGGTSDTEEALAVLRSRQFTETFIEQEQLMPVLFPKKWDAARSRWKEGSRPPTPAQAYKYFDKKIRSVLQDKKTGLVTLQIDWRDREQAAAWANELVRRLNAEMRSRAITKAEASIGYLEKELLTTSVVETREAINRLIEAQVKQRMLANVTQEYAFRVVDTAMPPDQDDPAMPRKVVLLVAAPFMGFALGVALVLLAGLFAGLRSEIAR